MSKYKKVYADIKEKIEQNIWQANQEMPTENELMEIYSYSKDTIRKALSLLEMDGYIQKRQGRNSIILDHNLVRKPFVSELKTVSELNRSAHHQVQTELTNLYIVQGQPEVMKELEVDEKTDLYRVSRVRTIDGERLEYEISYFDRRIVPYLSKEVAESSIYQYLEEELGLEISHSRREISFRFATEEEKSLLDLADYDMVVSVTSTTYLADGRPFQYGTITYRPDKVTFVSMAKR
ncbi:MULTISPECIES: GntR family transcriptional regulator [Streptococcus]|uniref:GntR family transcriptional regulator n=1 Tax=Streptococcus suis TaxID=1307 RepID=A0A9X4RTP7_STRSU|nr:MULTISPECIES: GntR family transcriptional regulator [Streptococcus]MCL4934258.1 GntR family transcriptional regulator [Streptococcus suis]MDG4527339.1 GntR family transcriptional regulator [Streptococcus suis]MDG4529620.1 GntR family transcriptional regulator [Streptococcus suis]HEL1618004.1 GntR family transcriptional regulator [Streptococcus suis]HEL1961073.1 GntR family transcriptional regulator [Streptococcus suis]